MYSEGPRVLPVRKDFNVCKATWNQSAGGGEFGSASDRSSIPTVSVRTVRIGGWCDLLEKHMNEDLFQHCYWELIIEGSYMKLRF